MVNIEFDINICHIMKIMKNINLSNLRLEIFYLNMILNMATVLIHKQTHSVYYFQEILVHLSNYFILKPTNIRHLKIIASKEIIS